MEVRVTLTYKDLKAFHKQLAQEAPRRSFSSWLSFALGVAPWGVLAVVLFTDLLSPYLHRVPFLLGFLVVAVCYYLRARLQSYVYENAHWETVRKWLDEINANPWLVRATPDSLTVQTSDCSAVYSWASLLKVVQTNDRLFLFIDSEYAIIVPHSCFSSDEEIHTFADLCRGYFKEAKAASPPNGSSGITTVLPTAILPRP